MFIFYFPVVCLHLLATVNNAAVDRGTDSLRSYPEICWSSRGVAGYYDTVMKIEKLLYVL